MKKVITHTLLAYLATALATACLPAMAQDIVIDSGTDETVISRLPNAGIEEEFVCADSTDGTLGKCAGVILGVYTLNELFMTSEPFTQESGTVACDDGDMAIAPGYALANSDPVIVESIFASVANLNTIFIQYVTQAGDDFRVSLAGKCLDFAPAH